MRFFDAHAHLFPPRRLRGLIRWVRRAFPSHPVAVDVLLDELVDEMRACGTEYIVNLMFPLAPGEVDTLHDFNAQLAARIPGLLPMAGVHPANPNYLEQTIRALDDLDFVGVKIQTMVQQIDPFDKILHPVYAELEQRQRPLWLHTGFEYIYNFEFPCDVPASGDRISTGCCLPEHLFGYDQCIWRVGASDNVWPERPADRLWRFD